MILNVGGPVVAQTGVRAISTVSSHQRARFINKRLQI